VHPTTAQRPRRLTGRTERLLTRLRSASGHATTVRQNRDRPARRRAHDVSVRRSRDKRFRVLVVCLLFLWFLWCRCGATVLRSPSGRSLRKQTCWSSAVGLDGIEPSVAVKAGSANQTRQRSADRHVGPLGRRPQGHQRGDRHPRRRPQQPSGRTTPSCASPSSVYESRQATAPRNTTGSATNPAVLSNEVHPWHGTVGRISGWSAWTKSGAARC
jgi:hypothetical protein